MLVIEKDSYIYIYNGDKVVGKCSTKCNTLESVSKCVEEMEKCNQAKNNTKEEEKNGKERSI